MTSVHKKTAAGLASLLLASAALAAPYASYIRVGDLDLVTADFPVNINYRLNEAADSVTIRIKDNTTATVATFSGTTTSGANTVAWDGTANNSAGTVVGVGSGYKVEIEAVKAAGVAATIRQVKSPDATGIFSGFSPRDAVVPMDPSSDLFGLILVGNSYNGGANKAAAVIPFFSNLDTLAGDNGFASRKLKHPLDPAGTAPGTMNNGTVWGVGMVPNSDNFFAVGQNLNTVAVPSYMFAANTGGVLANDQVSADPDAVATGLANPRDGEVVLEGAQLWVYFTNGNSEIRKVRFDGTKLTGAAPFNILNLTNTALYSKDLRFDSAGNLYWTSKSGRIFRWNAAQVQAIDDTTDTKLTEADAVWTITAGVGFDAGNWMGSTIDRSGNVYLVTGTSDRIYSVGNASTATLTKAMDPTTDLVFDPLTSVGTTYGSLQNDYAGNLLVWDGGPEMIETITTGAASDVTIPAPTSQTFVITSAANPSSSVSNWQSVKD